jgi:CheY-like chemotaxis protein
MPESSQPRRTVLAIDDELLFGTALRRVLGFDYQFLHVTSATEALALLQSGRRFDVIISDLLLPAMTGPQFFEAARELDPEICRHVLFMTGGAATDEARDFLLRVPNGCLRKPFDREELTAAIDKILKSLGNDDVVVELSAA